MKITLRFLIFVLGLFAIGLVVWLGLQTASNQSPQLVALFGIAAAIAVPLGFALIGYAFTAQKQQTLDRLAKVPEIERLLNEAKSHEEKIKVLEKQRQQLADIVLFETRRQTLISRKESIERQSVQLFDELQAIDGELTALGIPAMLDQEIISELTNLRERILSRRHGDIVFTFGRRTLILEGDTVRSVPWGDLLYWSLTNLARVSEWLSLKVRQVSERRNVRGI